MPPKSDNPIAMEGIQIYFTHIDGSESNIHIRNPKVSMADRIINKIPIDFLSLQFFKSSTTRFLTALSEMPYPPTT
jgi:hypothetical protein